MSIPSFSTKRVLVKSSQPRPHIKPLPYFVQFDVGRGRQNFRGFWQNARGWPSHVEANNKALDNMSDISDQAADLLVAFLERQKAIDMVADGLMKITRVARAIRKKDPKLMRKVLYGKSKAEKRMILSRPANIWLAYHFGVIPTIMDIHHAMGVLVKDAPALAVQAVGKGTESFGFSGRNYDWNRSGEATTIVKLGGEVTHVNRNAMLAAQLGFTQPLSTIWEMTPFSWFVDYFVNVGDMLSNLEPRFPGITFQNQYTTRYFSGTFQCFYKQYSTPAFGKTVPPGRWDEYAQSYEGEFVEVERTLGWPNKMLDVSGVAALSSQRASYIAAVVVTILSGWKK